MLHECVTMPKIYWEILLSTKVILRWANYTGKQRFMGISIQEILSMRSSDLIVVDMKVNSLKSKFFCVVWILERAGVILLWNRFGSDIHWHAIDTKFCKVTDGWPSERTQKVHFIACVKFFSPWNANWSPNRFVRG